MTDTTGKTIDTDNATATTIIRTRNFYFDLKEIAYCEFFYRKDADEFSNQLETVGERNLRRRDFPEKLFEIFVVLKSGHNFVTDDEDIIKAIDEYTEHKSRLDI